MANGKGDKDVFRQFSESTTEQVANIAQLAAEARRLGLIPEFPRELIEKLDVGGTLLDLFRLQIKHTTAIASLLGPQARNLEKLNQWSALIATSKSSAPRKVENEPIKPGDEACFELSIDNPVDRTQKLSIELNKLYRLADGEAIEFAPEPENRKTEQRAAAQGALAWNLYPPVVEVEPHTARSAYIAFKVDSKLFTEKPVETKGKKSVFETTAIVKLSPLGTLHRYQLRLTLPW